MTEQEITQAAKNAEKGNTFSPLVQRAKGVNSAFGIGFIEGAEWALNKFEENRLAACDSQTPEEAEREQKFVVDFIRKNNRQPTFSDCIEITRKEMISKACKWLASVNLDYYQIREGVFSKELVQDLKKEMEL